MKRLHTIPITEGKLCKKNDIEEWTEGTFPINLKLIDQYQRKHPILKAIYKMGTQKKVLFVEELI